LAFRKKNPPSIVVGAQGGLGILPLPLNDLGYRKSFPGIVDGGLENVSPRQAAEFLMQSLPTLYRSGDRYRVDSLCGHGVKIFPLESFDGHSFGRGSAAVVPMQFARLRFVIDDEQIAAQAAHHRLHHAEDGIGRNRRVYCRTAASQYRRTCLRRKGLRGRHDPLAGDNHGACLLTLLRRKTADDGECQETESPHKMRESLSICGTLCCSPRI
jgi:hypothetical protein